MATRLCPFPTASRVCFYMVIQVAVFEELDRIWPLHRASARLLRLSTTIHRHVKILHRFATLYEKLVHTSIFFAPHIHVLISFRLMAIRILLYMKSSYIR